jgi:hypothetical protein
MAASVGAPPPTAQFENPTSFENTNINGKCNGLQALKLFFRPWCAFDPHVSVTHASEVPEILCGTFFGVAQNLGDVALAATPLI